MIHPIRLFGDPVLRRRADPVTLFGPELERLAADMLETMYAAEGVGLAAPQIGVLKRVFVALEVPDAEEGAEADGDGRREHVMVNPVITRRAGQQLGRDGCLSIPGLAVEDVPRDLVVHVDYQDLEGVHRTLVAEGYFAHVLQHEADHLDGVLFFDHLSAARRGAFLEENRRELADMQRQAKAFLRGLRARAADTRAGAGGAGPQPSTRPNGTRARR